MGHTEASLTEDLQTYYVWNEAWTLAKKQEFKQ